MRKTRTLFLCCIVAGVSACTPHDRTPLATPGPKRAAAAAAPADSAVASRELLRRWTAACPVKPILGGVCAKYLALAGGVTRCAAGVDAIVAVPRRPDAAVVQKEIAQQIARRLAPARRSALRFIRAERLFEAFLARQMPVAQTARKFHKELISYLKAKTAALRAAQNAYRALAKGASRPWDRAAKLRLGLLHVFFGRELMLTAVPRPPRLARMPITRAREFQRVFTEKFCDALNDKAMSLLTKGIGLLGWCGRWRPRQDARFQACRRALKEAKGLLISARQRGT